MRLIAAPLLLAALAAAAPPAMPSRPSLGTAEGRCRPHEPGPAILIEAQGLKDRTGTLRAELYPPDEQDFLADDNVLLSEGKTFRRVTEPVPAQGPALLCIRVPAPGTYTLSLVHDRDGKPKFSLLHDGIGFPGNPRLGHGKPPAAKARITVGRGVSRTVILLNYLHGLFAFSPLGT